MIPVDITTAIFLYLMFSLCSIFTVWMWFEKSEHVRPGEREKNEIWNCLICTYTYVDSTHDTISKCPRCHSLNRKGNLGVQNDN